MSIDTNHLESLSEIKILKYIEEERKKYSFFFTFILFVTCLLVDVHIFSYIFKSSKASLVAAI